jgi:YhcH/YjgK/YiaL family protein
MIIDTIENAPRYKSLDPGLAAAIDFFTSTDLAKLKPGRVNIDGERVFALVSDYVTKCAEEGRWEVHEKYFDVHVVFSGGEQLGYAPTSVLRFLHAEREKDLLWYDGNGDYVTLRPRTFAIIWPGEAHMPGMAIDAPNAIRKVVIKVRAS